LLQDRCSFKPPENIKSSASRLGDLLPGFSTVEAEGFKCGRFLSRQHHEIEMACHAKVEDQILRRFPT
jgi:hypothetical protein